MSQNELDRAVARATGEDLAEIRRRGFSVADPGIVEYDPEPYDAPQFLDWDEIEHDRNVAVHEQRQFRLAAA